MKFACELKYPGDSHYNNNKQEMIIDEQDLKILAGVICQDGFIRIHGVAKIRTSFVPRSRLPLLRPKIELFA